MEPAAVPAPKAKPRHCSGSNLPNVVWGYGKLDGFAAITCIMLNSDEQNFRDTILFYPNPASDFISFTPFNSIEKYEIEIFDLRDGLIYYDPLFLHL